MNESAELRKAVDDYEAKAQRVTTMRAQVSDFTEAEYQEAVDARGKALHKVESLRKQDKPNG